MSGAATLARAAAEPRIGPNAVTQLAAVLENAWGRETADAVFADANLLAYRTTPPSQMVPQSHAAALHRALYQALPQGEAEALAFEAGARTADYLLAHRIPKPAQALMRLAPPRLAAAMLLQLMAAHAWTFAGSGEVRVRAGKVCRLEIVANPLATAPCEWHRGVFQRLFGELVRAPIRVRETACTGAGAPACVFEMAIG
ncbi:MAG: bacteriochlorophyll 4-vinyl reductase [Alphaproteobacteria bacterium]|nr:bacteriochlorophyll 4-vinyl reductase [Alphaproteobacteria bacterium]